MKQLTEHADAISLVIILHEELVAVHYVFGEVPRERLVKNSGSGAEERRDDSRLEVCPDPGLFSLLILADTRCMHAWSARLVIA